MKRYEPAAIEPKWQERWAESQIYAAADFSDKPKFVMLTEFPYPSGAGLHMGHLREYTLGDIVARHKRAQGYNVLFPMGYDAFGLPTENYAIKNKISPQAATEVNTAAFRRTLDIMGYSIDWNRSFATSDPEYYRWTQWMFLQFYKAGLAYQDEIAINWCPFCKTGLANEEVVNGRHERCDNLVEKKLLKQWMLRITDYAERLIDGLKDVDYPSRIADQQINWIGKSVGAEIDFVIANDTEQSIKVFTTRPDTIFGATFMVLAPEHPLVAQITTQEQKATVDSYLKTTQSKSDIERQENKEKTGVPTGAYAINPATKGKIPIWVADYVLMGYGTGAIMSVPRDDERDREFATKFNLPIDETYEYTDKIYGEKKVQYKLRDWVYSRQHYWGEPIPIIHCPNHGAVPVPDDQLPVELPPVDHYEPTDDAKSPLSRIPEWVNTTCPTCDGPAKRETDTMPNWAGSNWYYLRYYDAHNNQKFADPDKLKYWDMVDLYLGGMEHTTLHLLYSRFLHQFLYDQGLVPTPEPYASRRGQGIILAADGRKMSKSLGNVVDPTPLIESGYGADAARLAVTFLAPFDQTTPWSPEAVAGCYRFLGRVWNLAGQVIDETTEPNDALLRAEAKTVKKVSDDLANMNFNTAIAALMEYLNALNKDPQQVSRKNIETLLILLAPFAPHLAAELYEQFGNTEPIENAGWPTVDEKYLVDDQITVGVQVNGKLRGEITVNSDETRENIEKLALEQENVVKFIGNQKPARVIYVPGRVVNVVI
jgi:leucyl-tRNA synthetase